MVPDQPAAFAMIDISIPAKSAANVAALRQECAPYLPVLMSALDIVSLTHLAMVASDVALCGFVDVVNNPRSEEILSLLNSLY